MDMADSSTRADDVVKREEWPAEPSSTPSGGGVSSADRPADARQQAPVRWREFLAVLLLVIVSDLTIYRGRGFAGYALLFAAAPALLWLGAIRPRFGPGLWITGLMLLALAAKTLWLGSPLLVGLGMALLVAFAMTLSGLYPYVLEVVVFASQTVLAGYEGILHYARSASGLRPVSDRASWLSVGLPLAALLAFGMLFILANPDLLASFGDTVEWLVDLLRQWILHFSPEASEVLFWMAVCWIAVGLLRPVVKGTVFERASDGAQREAAAAEPPAPALLYAPFRNTLATVAVLFAVYLVFEFQTLWFQEFPEGFYYSGYAHEGAAWLTVALGLATVILSLIFRGRVLRDPRVSTLRRLAWIWSAENLLLALAVYHRMGIYIGFNGMTRMRTVGLFGMSCVVAGFVLVVGKIVRHRDFVWLVRRQLWALALTVYLFALTPVDTLVVSYNVRRILSGDPAPSVQISVHPISSEGVLLLKPLLDCDDPVIREGVRAMLAQRDDEAEALARERRQRGWTAYQAADRLALEGLRADRGRWAEYRDRQRRAAALDRFHKYAYQWY